MIQGKRGEGDYKVVFNYVIWSLRTLLGVAIVVYISFLKEEHTEGIASDHLQQSVGRSVE